MKRKLAIALPILFIFFILTPVYADWTLENQTGQWVQCTRIHWQCEGWNEGNATWQTTINNFTGYSLSWNFSDFEIWREWWQYYTWKDVLIRLKISDGANTTLIVLKYNGWTHVFGATRGVTLYYSVNETVSEWNDVTEMFLVSVGVETMDEMHGYISIDPENKAVQFAIYREKLYNTTSPDYAGTTVNFSNNFLGKTVTLELNYYHGGQGKITYNLETENFSYVSPPPFEDVVTGRQEWWEAVWNSIQGFFAEIGSWSAYIYSGISFFWNLVIVPFAANIPTLIAVLPIIVIFWFLDAIVTSIQKGDLQPIGNAVMTVIDFLRGLIQTIVNIAQTIWNIIKFW